MYQYESEFYSEMYSDNQSIGSNDNSTTLSNAIFDKNQASGTTKRGGGGLSSSFSKSSGSYFKSSLRPGSRIIIADTGMKTQHIVGSSDEDLYFKVAICSAMLENDRVTLFYNSPREYAVHLATKLSPMLSYRRNKVKNRKLSMEELNEKVDKILLDIAPMVDNWRQKRFAA
jgi:hypothetical protein